jgi:flavin-dependent dehydrogenase
MRTRTTTEAPQQVDVAIIGGGLAGLTLALQLRRELPHVSVLVVERNAHPVPEAAFKVGESTSELGAHYLRDVLGLAEHLKTQQIVKLGLRFFFTAGDNSDIARRVELGLRTHLSASTYQLDRGRLENALADLVRQQGVELVDGGKVEDVEISRDGNTLAIVQDGAQRKVGARWLVDASGRPGMIKRRLGLARRVDHDPSAAWFRIAVEIDPDAWSAAPEWRARVKAGLRRTSTIHLMGRGYWVWLIPLASGSTSIGLVADERFHPFQTYNSFDKLMAWLRTYEPQCAAAVEAHPGKIQDFRVLRHYAYGCERVFSPDRWCLTGESGLFLDPFYSPGTDFIAIANGFVVKMVDADLRGEAKLDQLIQYYDHWLLRTFDGTLKLFADQYTLMGNAQVMSVKTVWDFLRYWGSIALLTIQHKHVDVAFTRRIAQDFYRLAKLDERVQAFFREWDELDDADWDPAFLDYKSVPYVEALNKMLATSLTEAEVERAIDENADLCEQVAAAIMARALNRCRLAPPGGAIDPYTLSLHDCEPAHEVAQTPDPGVEAAMAPMWLEAAGVATTVLVESASPS